MSHQLSGMGFSVVSFTHSFVVSSDGLSGGLALFWCESLRVEIQSANERFIDAYVRISEHDPLSRLPCVYGEPRFENRPACGRI